jgi:hypothetical protein
MSSETLNQLKGLVQELELLNCLRCKIERYRRISEHTESTLDRLLELAERLICRECRGYGTNLIGNICPYCDGTGNLLHLLPKGEEK